MRITNKLGLPEALVEAVRYDEDNYSGPSLKMDMGVGKLIGPPQIRMLLKQHGKNLSEDASARIWMLFGKAIHKILEDAEPSALTESAYVMDCLGWKIGCVVDRLVLRPDNVLQDYKVCSVWKLILGDFADWEQQLNLNAHIVQANGIAVDKLEIIAILRDWSQTKADREGKDYPQTVVVKVGVDMWSKDIADAFMHVRTQLHKHAASGDVPFCTDSERWLRGEKWACMKKGRKSAVRVLPSEADARDYLYSQNLHEDANYSVVHRPGTYTRCESYCPVRTVCPQWASGGLSE